MRKNVKYALAECSRSYAVRNVWKRQVRKFHKCNDMPKKELRHCSQLDYATLGVNLVLGTDPQEEPRTPLKVFFLGYIHTNSVFVIVYTQENSHLCNGSPFSERQCKLGQL